MTKITSQGKDIHTHGTLPDVESLASDFTFTKTDMSDVNLFSFKGQKLLNIFVSLDTITCANSVRKFSKEAIDVGNVTVINLSMDLPFAQKRFAETEKINNVIMGSVFRSNIFKVLPIDITDGPLRGLCSRVVIIINDKNEIKYTEQVSELSHEPNYAEALDALKI